MARDVPSHQSRSTSAAQVAGGGHPPGLTPARAPKKGVNRNAGRNPGSYQPVAAPWESIRFPSFSPPNSPTPELPTFFRYATLLLKLSCAQLVGLQAQFLSILRPMRRFGGGGFKFRGVEGGRFRLLGWWV